MPEEQRGDDNARQPENHSTSQPPIQPPSNQSPPPYPGNSDPRDKETNAIRQLERDVKTGEWWLIGIGIFTLLVNIGIAKIYYGQLVEMRKATTATQDAVQVARDTLTETQTFNAQQRADNAAATLDAKTLADRNAAQSEKTLNATIDNFHREQRAWIGVTGFSVEPDPLIKIDPKYANNDIAVAGFINSGKTPARHVHALVGVGFTMSDHALNGQDEEWMNLQIENIQKGKAKLFSNSAPYANVTAGYATVPMRFSIPLIEEVSMGDIAPNTTFRYVHPRDFHAAPQSKMEVFVFGIITYVDVNNAQRSTKFCSYRPENWDEKFNACPIFNDMN